MMFGRPPEVWLISGSSAVSRALAAHLDRSALLDGETLRAQVVRGRATDHDEAERQLELAIRNLCLLARSYAEAGFTPVIDQAVTTRYQLEAFRGYLRGARLHFVVSASAHAAGDEAMRAELAAWGYWVDQSRPVDAVVAACVEDERASVLPSL